MKKILLIFFAFLMLVVFNNSIYCSYTLTAYSINSPFQNLQSSNYILQQSTLGENLVTQSMFSNYNLSNGYIYYVDSFSLPKLIKVVGKKGFVSPLNLQAVEQAVLQILDYENAPVRDIVINYSIIDKPENAAGDTISTTITNETGLSYVTFNTGNKSGAYIIKADYADFQPQYIGFHSEEIILPAKEWRMISVNKIPQASEIENVFIGVKPEYIYRWYPEVEEHLLHKKYREVSRINSGEGYFIILPSETVLKLSGQYKSDTAVIQLKSGWNQIGTPYYYLTAWSNANIVYNGQRYSTASAEENNILQNKIFWYKNNEYLWGPNQVLTTPLLYVWSGFWVYAHKDCQLELSPEFAYYENSRVNLAPKKAAPSENNWQIILSATGNKTSDMINFFGVSEIDTEAGIVRKAPGLTDLIGVYFENNGAVVTSDIRRAPLETYQLWNFNLYTGDNTKIKLSFNDIESIAEQFDIYLIDSVNKKNYNLREQANIEFDSSKFKTLNYKIVAGLPEYVSMFLAPLLIKENFYARPNPWKTGDGNLEFVYSAPPTQGNINLKIFDLAGIKVTEKNIQTNGGLNISIPWDRKNDAGKTVGSGVYIFIMEYTSAMDSFKLIDKLAIVR